MTCHIAVPIISVLQPGKAGSMLMLVSVHKQIMKVIPYSATQLYSYELYKRRFCNRDGVLSIRARLLAGACAGMTATVVRILPPHEYRHCYRQSITWPAYILPRKLPPQGHVQCRNTSRQAALLSSL